MARDPAAPRLPLAPREVPGAAPPSPMLRRPRPTRAPATGPLDAPRSAGEPRASPDPRRGSPRPVRRPLGRARGAPRPPRPDAVALPTRPLRGSFRSRERRGPRPRGAERWAWSRGAIPKEGPRHGRRRLPMKRLRTGRLRARSLGTERLPPQRLPPQRLPPSRRPPASRSPALRATRGTAGRRAPATPRAPPWASRTSHDPPFCAAGGRGKVERLHPSSV